LTSKIGVTPSDSDALKQRREALRAFVDGIASHVGAPLKPEAEALITPIRRLLRRYADRVMEVATLLAKPDSFLEGERARRYALAADRMLAQLYEAPRPVMAT
jgi:hypothetical protein